MSGAEIAIASLIVSSLQLAVAVKQTADASAPAIPTGLQEKKRWLQCTLKNQTQFSLLLQQTYHDSGRFYSAPGSVASFHQMTFSVCSRDNSVGTGVSGGASFRADLDHHHSFHFAIGWTNPYLGSFKAGVIEAKAAKDGYNAASGDGSFVQSEHGYKGKDEKGENAHIIFHISATPGQKPMFVITEVREDTNKGSTEDEGEILPMGTGRFRK
ncbi:hypothetical protein CJF32_00003258 [Rutstroemia sp. NJR-2017a WRK4]|nr:hypothetical protein CJF32_00003258 [Rutstroemia sp. NJR-2017a WRK4]